MGVGNQTWTFCKSNKCSCFVFNCCANTPAFFFFFKGRILYGWEDIPVGKSIFFYKLENLNSNSWHPYKQLGMETGRPEVLTGSQNRTSSSVRDSVSRLKCIPAHSRAPNGICTHTYIYIHTPHTFPRRRGLLCVVHTGLELTMFRLGWVKFGTFLLQAWVLRV